MATSNSSVFALSRRRVIAAALLLFLGSPVLFAGDKKDYALIYGTVFDADGRVVPGVPVKLQRVGDKKPKWELVSDHSGEFAQRVPTGDNDYVVIADIKVPKGGTKPQTKVHIHSNERADISIHLAK
ncbi:carboxypeptidase-like regulatory domain-containing protein [Candidatus Korobacter versatilis]|nr:carboxypeptidase-like regulatory domain-containing protein [Candidatus Koribacter versatilis]